MIIIKRIFTQFIYSIRSVMQGGWWVPVQVLESLQGFLSMLTEWGSTTRCMGFTQALLWHKWLTSKFESNFILWWENITDSLWAAISTLDLVLGSCTNARPYPLGHLAPVHIIHSIIEGEKIA
jgi:hypothetical protein